jgi:hypothetical protein
MLNAHSPVHYKAFAFILSQHLLSTTNANPCYKQCCSKGGSHYEDVAGAGRTQPPVDCLWSLVPSFPGLSVNI